MASEFKPEPIMVSMPCALARIAITRGVAWNDCLQFVQDSVNPDGSPHEEPLDLTDTVLKMKITVAFEHETIIDELDSRLNELMIYDAVNGRVQIFADHSRTRVYPLSPPCGWAFQIIGIRQGERAEFLRGSFHVQKSNYL